jgi:hypothetical protein
MKKIKWKIQHWYYYYEIHIDNINKIIINELYNYEKLDNIDFYKKFVIFLFKNSYNYRTPYIDYDYKKYALNEI